MSDILNCGQAKQESELVRFTYQCPKYWQNLQVTENDSVRFCDACQENVFYCTDKQEAEQHALQGHCIAIASLMSDRNASVWDTVEELGMVKPRKRQEQSAISEFYDEEIETRVYED